MMDLERVDSNARGLERRELLQDWGHLKPGVNIVSSIDCAPPPPMHTLLTNWN